jgi:hypothetical protein
MPARGTRSNGPQFRRDSEDTGYTLRFIHTKKELGEEPTYEAFIQTPEGQRLLNTYNRRKVRYNFETTLQRYNSWSHLAGGTGKHGLFF